MQGILLAAGHGKRFRESLSESGQQQSDKLLSVLPQSGQSVLQTSASTLKKILPHSLAIIQPHQIARKSCLQTLGLNVVESPEAVLGIGHAIAAGVAASKEAEAWLIMLADMPWINSNLVLQVHKKLKAPDSIVMPVYQGKRGHPVAFGADWREALMTLTGDQGAKQLISNHDSKVDFVEWHDASIIQDVDCVADLNRSA